MKKLTETFDSIAMIFVGFLFGIFFFASFIMKEPVMVRIMGTHAPEQFIVTCQLNKLQRIYCTAKDIENE